MIYTIVGQPFREWVEQQCLACNEKVIHSQNLNITMDNDIFDAFQKSRHVSTQNGISSHLFKDSAKRRRSKAQILEDKAAEVHKRQRLEQLETEMQQRMMAWQEMEAALESSETQRLAAEQNMQSFRSIYDAGYV